jgi:hypothetical protein
VAGRHDYGWVVLGNEAALTTTKRFDSKENPLAANRPVLEVDYTPQILTLSKWGLVVLVGLLVSLGVGVVLVRRRKPVLQP